ncbi:MAG: glycerophosphodiester phosphodiesterase [Dysgonamonadaceae bacterium]|jgi:glycerophosphoryl diester phosphodiesterase|nr:glycerophosphodiester phosphodiesterase [Dysgonamonadaceae bacterium]
MKIRLFLLFQFFLLTLNGAFSQNDSIRNMEYMYVKVSAKQQRPRIICHRGYWNTSGSAQNSIASLAKAQELQEKYGNVIYGSEFDVWITTDNVVVLNHDGIIDGINIENSNYKSIKNKVLENGEKIPTFADFLEQGRKNTDVKLICEIKTHNSRENNNRAVDAAVKMVKNAGMEDQVEYIAFDWENCLRIHELAPNAIVGYLSGDKTPQESFDAGVMCLDYNMYPWKNNIAWIKQARSLGMFSNVWTVNAVADMKYFIELGADFLTTDNPVALKDLLEQRK